MQFHVLPAGDFGRDLAPLGDLLIVLHRHALFAGARLRGRIGYLMEILLLDDLWQWTQGRLLSLCLVFDRLVSQFAVDYFVQDIVVIASQEGIFSLVLFLEQYGLLLDEKLLEVDKLFLNLLLIELDRLPLLSLHDSQFGQSVLALLRFRHI